MLQVTRLEKTFKSGGARVGAVRGMTFRVERGEFFTLLGPSGCGKTTTLRCIAGLERIDGGEIVLDGRIVDGGAPRVHVPPYGRPIGMVFQSYALWPHLTVFENVAYPLRVRRPAPPEREITERVTATLRLVDMESLASRPAPLLSGGQQQRVALARAVVSQPTLLLLDEPLSNLDAQLREQMRGELAALIASTGITTLFVTHDQQEALAMSSRIAIVDRGCIVQEGTPADIYDRPRSPFVASFVGAANVIPGCLIESAASGRALVDCGGIRLVCSSPSSLAGPAGAAVAVVARPERLALAAPGTDAPNVFDAVVDTVTFLGSHVDCRVRSPLGTLVVRAHHGWRPHAGDHVRLSVAPDDCLALEATSPAVAAPSRIPQDPS